MDFWLDRNSESDNVVVLQQNNILVGSCDKEAYDKVFEQLTQNVPPIEVLGSEDVKIIPFDKLQNLTSRDTDLSIDLQYLAKKSSEDLSLDFETLEQKTACLDKIIALDFQQLNKKVAQQSALAASFTPLLSLLCSIGLGSLYIDRLRWVTIIVCGLWALLSLYGLYTRVTQPPVITSLSLKGRYARKFMSGIKTGVAYLVVALIALVGTTKLPLMYGEKAIAEHSELESLDAQDIDNLIANGADINYRTKDGYTSLHNAIYMEDVELIAALVAAGADVNLPVVDHYDNALDLALSSASNNKTIIALLDTAAPFADLTGMLERAIYNELDVAVVEKLVAQGANIDEINEDGDNLLYVALSNDSEYELIAYFYNQGVSVDFEIDELAPLAYAKTVERFDLVTLFKTAQSAETLVVNKPKSAFLAQFIQQETQLILKDKGNVLLKVLIATDDESKAEWQAMADNNIQLKAINAYAKSNTFDIFLENCPDLDSALAVEMDETFTSYTQANRGYIKAGAEVIDNNTILTIDDKTVLSSQLGQSMYTQKMALIDDFNDVNAETEADLLNKCHQAIAKAKLDDQIAKAD